MNLYVVTRRSILVGIAVVQSMMIKRSSTTVPFHVIRNADMS